MEPHNTNKILVVYEIAQILRAIAVPEYHDHTIIPLNIWVEEYCKEHHIPYISSRAFLPSDAVCNEVLHTSQNIAREWYRTEAMSFFTYRDIRIGQIIEPMFDTFLQAVLYYRVVLQNVIQQYPHSDISVMHSTTHFSETFAVLDAWTIQAPTIAAQTLQREHVSIKTVGDAPVPQCHPRQYRRSYRHVLFSLFNRIISILPRKKNLVLVSDYWSSIEPLTAHVSTDTGFIFTDYREIHHMSWKDLLSFRIRFKNIHDSISRSQYENGHIIRDTFSRSWNVASDSVVRWFGTYGCGLEHAIQQVCACMVTQYAERLVADIESAFAMVDCYKPNVIILRASIGGRQHHFFILAQVAQLLNIPSIELQHAGAIFDINSVHARLEARYLAAYGRTSQDFFAQQGTVSLDRVIPVGSCRLDRIGNLGTLTTDERIAKIISWGLDPKKTVVCVAMPWEHAGPHYLDFSSYEVEDLFKLLAHAREHMPDMQYLCKFRTGSLKPHHALMAKQYLVDRYVLIEHEDSLLCIQSSDIVISPNSTIMYESFVSKKPLILYPWKSFDPQISLYQQGALYVDSVPTFTLELQRLCSDPDYRNTIVQKGQTFIAEKYLFDGNSARRTATLINDVVLKKV